MTSILSPLPSLPLLSCDSATLKGLKSSASSGSASSVRTASSASDAGSSPAPLTPVSDVEDTNPLLGSLDLTSSLESCIFIPSGTEASPLLMKSLYGKHANGRCFALCLPQLPMSDAESFMFVREAFEPLGLAPGRWTRDRIVVKDKEVEYYVSKPSKSEDVNDAEHPIRTFTEQNYAVHQRLFGLAGLRAVLTLPSSDGRSVLHILEKPTVVFPVASQTPGFLPPSLVNQAVQSPPTNTMPNFPCIANIPTHDEWKTLWSAWDLVTLGMIPETMLHQKPIDLRHKCLFYIGHIPTFLDMLLSKSIGGGPSEPKHFWNIFERGIDPHVDDPDHCHNHSEVPDKDEDWPTLEAIMGFRDTVRGRLATLYAQLQSGERKLTRNIARTLVMTLEHEGWHVETLLYMLIQRAGTGTLPPPGFVTPPFSLLAHQWDAIPAPDTPTVTLGPATITLGHDDSEGDDFTADGTPVEADDSFLTQEWGWDNESPARTVNVGKFCADWRPITNAEFESYLLGEGKDTVSVPKSWVVTEDGKFEVRTVYGPVSMDIARHWPVMTSYDDFMVYAKWKGGRLPTEPELRLFLDTYEVGHENGANVGFRNWHPIPSTAGLEEHGGKGSNGGVWEWTSTLFDTHDGLVPTNLFTGYSTDFFDTKHQVVLGASYATIPRLASRRTVRNFWQHNYPYPWVGARVVYDI